MKKTNKFGAKFLVTTLMIACVSTMSIYGQTATTPQAQPAQIAGQPGTTSELQSQNIQNTPTENMEETGPPTRLNKCSQLIGSSVKNMQGQKLGKIEDVVINLGDGKVSYCVLAVDRGILASSKYVAVPLSAMRSSDDRSYLTLDVDKDKLANAQGFDRENWPSVSNPSWGAQPFWQSSNPAITSPSNHHQKTAPASGNYQNSDNNNPKADLQTPRQDGTNPTLDDQKTRDNNGSSTPSDTTH